MRKYDGNLSSLVLQGGPSTGPVIGSPFKVVTIVIIIIVYVIIIIVFIIIIIVFIKIILIITQV